MTMKHETQSSRIALRKICQDDAEFMIKLARDPETARYIPGLIADRKEMTDWINSLGDNSHEYIITLKDDGSPIGECGLTLLGDSAEIGIMLLPDYWNKGYGTETVYALKDKAGELGVRELTAITDAENAALIHILSKLGFEKTAILWHVRINDTGDTEKLRHQDMVEYRMDI